jgi:hypothetical protein
MRRPCKLSGPSRNARGEGSPRRPALRRLLGLTLIVAGLGMLMSGIHGAFFH